MNTLHRLIPALVLLLCCLECRAQILWSGTEYGMSTDQVRAKVSGAMTPPSPSRLANGAEELLRLTGLELVGKPFTASFYFNDKRLTQVTLTLAKGEDFHSASLSFRSLKEALTSKYGREISSDEQEGLLRKKEATWISGGTNINLIVLTVGSTNANLNVNYQVRVAHEAGKL